MDEVVFLPVLSGSSDFVGNSACYDLWRHQSDCLGPERMDLRVRLENGRRLYSQFIFLYSVGVQSFTILNIRIKDDKLEKPDCRAASVIDISGSIRSRSACSILFLFRYL